MKISIVQLVVGRDLAANLKRILTALENSQNGEWVIFPEGVLSGYFPDDDEFHRQLDPARIDAGIDEIQRIVTVRQCNCIFGTATCSDGVWRNSVVTITAAGRRHVYHKIELSALDRIRFEPGTSLEVHRAGDLAFGVLACRELLFPAMWSRLKSAGAQIVFHINNAIQPQDGIWDHIFITRAIEQGIFVCSVNNGSPPQKLASCLVAPSGQVSIKTRTGCDEMLSAWIDPGEAIADLAARTDF